MIPKFCYKKKLAIVMGKKERKKQRKSKKEKKEREKRIKKKGKKKGTPNFGCNPRHVHREKFEL